MIWNSYGCWFNTVDDGQNGGNDHHADGGDSEDGDADYGDADDGDADARKGNLSCGVASTSLICPLVLLCRKGICWLSSTVSLTRAIIIILFCI